MQTQRIVVIGNSGSGKSTLASALARREGLVHVDLDTVAWRDTMPPSRLPLEDSLRRLDPLLDPSRGWVAEGCYADIAERLLPRCTRLVFLNPGIEACIANCQARPWEPHKYSSPAAQNRNLTMLLEWVRDYATRDDECSLLAHRRLFDSFAGAKIEHRELASLMD